MKSFHKFVLLGISLLTLSLGASAQDLDCSSGFEARYYDQGFGTQRQVISYLWTQNFKKECHRLDDFISAVTLPFGLNQPQSPSLRCRNRGLMDGLHAALEDIQNDCTTDCIENGKALGELTGAYACQSAQPVFQKTLSVCGMNAQMACRTALDSYIHQNCPSQSFIIQDLMTTCEF